MKRILLPALFTLAASVVFAQAPVVRQDSTQQAPKHAHHQHDPHKMAAHLSKKLNLTPDQSAKLEPVLVAQQQKMADLRANTSLTPQQMHEQMIAVHKDTQAQLAGILTPDQLQQMKAMHHEHGRHGAEGTQTPTAS